MAGNSYGPARADLYEDMRDFDRLPTPVRRVLCDAPVSFKAGTILAVWRLHELDGGSVATFVPKLKGRMRAALAKADEGGVS